MKILKAIAVVGIVLVLLYVFLAKFSVVESKYECDGTYSIAGSTEQLKLFVRFQEFRPWVGLWSDSDANMWLEIPNSLVDYYDNVRRVADSYQIYESKYIDRQGILGNFSTLSQTLALSIQDGFFDGTCTRLTDR